MRPCAFAVAGLSIAEPAESRFDPPNCLGCFRALKSVQEQSQIINSAIGRPVPKAPPIISANAESRFASHDISRSYIPLLHRAPTGIRLSPNDERSQKQTSDQGRDGFGIQALAPGQSDVRLNVYG